MRSKFIVLFFCTFLLSFVIACGSGSNSNNNTPITVGGQSQSSTVFVIVMENKNYADVIGSASMPFFNSLVPQGALATRYFANLHPSIGNYMMLTTGIPVPADDSFSGVVTNDNIARQLVSAGLTWKVYAEGIPSVGYTGGDSGTYLRRHNPFSYFSDVLNNSAQAANMVPLTQLSSDLGAGKLPNLAFIVPNAFNDGHDCLSAPNCTTQIELQQSDAFLQSLVPSIMTSAAFKNKGVLVVTWDESESDFTNGGGQVATLFLGPQVKVNYQSTSSYQHQDLLRMMSSRVGLASAPGAGGSASTMSEFFTQ